MKIKKTYFDTKQKGDCNGCGICALKCPVHAIEMTEDKEGFLYPKINEKKCIHCNLCKRICSNFNFDNNDSQKSFMIINKNRKELKHSASGGMFFILAKYVINNHGIVYGVKYDKNLNVVHDFSNNIQNCMSFQGSKYVRSDAKNIFPKIENDLNEGKLVLFTGTPCQCNALKCFLKKEYDNLILCDIICHANPSQKVFNAYISSLECKYNSKIKKIDFRSKKNGWSNSNTIIEFENRKIIEENTFYRAFVGELINRPSCHSCVFSGINRVTDITIGDFWGIEKILDNITQLDIEKGVNIVLINTEKGYNIFQNLPNNFISMQIPINLALKYNHITNLKPHKNREKFFNNLDSKDFIANVNKYLKKPLFKRVIKKILQKFQIIFK